MSSLEDAMGNLDEREQVQSGAQSGAAGQTRVSIGRVDHFFDKVGVAAIVLTGTLRVGDTVEIENGAETVRQKVESMQIDRRDVSEASAGDSVGIKVPTRIGRGSIVYRV